MLNSLSQAQIICLMSLKGRGELFANSASAAILGKHKPIMQTLGTIYPGSSTSRQRGVSTSRNNQGETFLIEHQVQEVESEEEDEFSALIFTPELEVFRRDNSGLSPDGSGLREDGSITLSGVTTLDAHMLQSDRRELDSHLSATEIYVPPLDYAGSVSGQDRQNLQGPIADVVRVIRDMMHSVLALVLLYAVSADSYEVYNIVETIFASYVLGTVALGLINGYSSFNLDSQMTSTLPVQLQIAGSTSQAAMQRMFNEARAGKTSFNFECKVRILQQKWRGIVLRVPGMGVINPSRPQYYSFLDIVACFGGSLRWLGSLVQKRFDGWHVQELLKTEKARITNLIRINDWIAVNSDAFMEVIKDTRPFPNFEVRGDEFGISNISEPISPCYINGVSNIICFVMQSIRSYEVFRPQWLYRTQLARIREAIEQRHAVTSSNTVLDPFLCALRGLQKHHRSALYSVVRQFIAEGMQATHYALQFGALLEGRGAYYRYEKVDPEFAGHDPEYFKIMGILSNLCLLGSSFSILNVGYKIYYYRKLAQVVAGYRKIIQSESELELKGHAEYERLKNDQENKNLFQAGDHPLSFEQVKMLARAKLIESHPMASCRLLIDMLQDEGANYARGKGEFGPAWQTLRSLGVRESDIESMQLATAEEATELLGLVLDVIVPEF